MELIYRLQCGENLHYYISEDELEEAVEKIIKDVEPKKIVSMLKDHYDDTVLEMFEVEFSAEIHKYFYHKAMVENGYNKNEGGETVGY